MKIHMGVDIGGTKILIGLLNSEGEILREKKYPMRRATQEEAEEAVFSSIADFLSNDSPRPDTLGIGAVGHIDGDRGIWLQSYNIPISHPVEMARLLEERYQIPVRMDNDVHCATLGEGRFGQGRQARCLLYCNLGTGLSAGVIDGGHLLRGADNYAGEVGYMYLNCGQDFKNLERVSSGGGLIEEARAGLALEPESLLARFQEEGRLHSAGIFDAAEQGDPLAVRLADQAVLRLGIGLCNLMGIFNPDRVVFGGGAARDPRYLSRVEALVRERCPGETLRSLEFFGLSELDGSRIGMIGAAALGMDLK